MKSIATTGIRPSCQPSAVVIGGKNGAEALFMWIRPFSVRNTGIHCVQHSVRLCRAGTRFNPVTAKLQEAIDAFGFNLKLHPEYTPFEDSGFLPFTLNGENGPGFEIQFVPASVFTSDDEALERYAAGRDFCISMSWHGNMKDLACVLLLSCALVKDFGAVVCYEGEAPESLDSMLAVMPEVLADADTQAVRDADRAVLQRGKKP